MTPKPKRKRTFRIVLSLSVDLDDFQDEYGHTPNLTAEDVLAYALEPVFEHTSGVSGSIESTEETTPT